MLTEPKEQSLLENALLNPALEQNWELTLEGWESASPLQRSAVRGFAESMRAFILNLSRDISSNTDELNRVLAIVYIHLKSQWIMFHTQVSYRLAEQDERGSEEASCRAALVYSVIEVIEGFIKPAEAARLSSMLEDPAAAAVTLFSSPAVGGDTQSKMRQMEERLALIDEERQMLEREVGAGDAEDIVRRFRRLQSQLADGEKKQQKVQEESARLKQQLNELDPTEAPRQLLIVNAEMAKARVQLNAFLQDREALERIIGTCRVEEIGALWHDVHQQITEQEKRLAYFESQKSQLEREAGGVATASEIAARLRAQNDQITALEEQVGPLRVALKALERELGHSDPAPITAMVTELRQALNRAETDMTELRYFHAVLSKELGTSDAHEIAARFKQMNETMVSFNSLASMMASLESDLTALNQRPDINGG